MTPSSFKNAIIIALEETEFTSSLQEELRSAGFNVSLHLVTKIEIRQLPPVDHCDLFCFVCGPSPETRPVVKTTGRIHNARTFMVTQGMPAGECLLDMSSHYSAQPRRRIYNEIWDGSLD